MLTWALPPTESGYSMVDNPGSTSVQFDGGASRFRADKANPTSRVKCMWRVDKTGFTTIRGYYATLGAGSLPFTIDLILDSGSVVNKVAHIIPGTFSMSIIDGLTYEISAELEVNP